MTKFISLFLFGILILLSPWLRGSAVAGKTVVVLFDLSASTNEKQGELQDRTIREQYLKDFLTVVNGMEEGDCLLGGVIGAISGSEGWAIPRTCLPEKPGTFSNPKVHNDKVREVRRSAAVRAKQVLTNPANSAQTDIFGAIRSSRAIFERYPDTRHILVMFSDMVQNSAELRMIHRAPGKGDALRLVKQWGQKGGAPELKGAEVYAWGARHPSEQARIQIEQFWRELFNALSARVIEYAPQAIRFAD